MVSVHQPDVADFGSAFDGFGSAFHLQVFDHNHIVSVLKRIAIGVLDHGRFFLIIVLDGTPTVGAFRTCEDQAIFIGVDRLTQGAGRQFGHDHRLVAQYPESSLGFSFTL